MANSKPASASKSASVSTKLEVLEEFDLGNVAITGFETTYSEAVKPNVKNGARVDFGSKTYATTYKVGFDKPVRANVGNASQVKKTVELVQFLAMKSCRDSQERDGVIPGIADDINNIRNLEQFPHVSKENVVKPGEELNWILGRFEELGASIPEGLIAETAPEAPVAEAPATSGVPAAADPAAEAKPVRRPAAPTQEA